MRFELYKQFSLCMWLYQVLILFAGGLYISSESKEDHIHFLVFTDVCGNRTYGVVAQYYQPIQVCCVINIFNKTFYAENVENNSNSLDF